MAHAENLRPAKKGERPGGRKKGVQNKLTREVKAAIENAFVTLGGENYLVRVGRKHPAVFAQLIGKLLPLQITGQGGGPVKAVMDVRSNPGSEAALQRAGELLARALAIGAPGANAHANPNGPVLPIEVCAGTLGHGAPVAPSEDPGSPE